MVPNGTLIWNNYAICLTSGATKCAVTTRTHHHLLNISSIAAVRLPARLMLLRRCYAIFIFFCCPFYLMCVSFYENSFVVCEKMWLVMFMFMCLKIVWYILRERVLLISSRRSLWAVIRFVYFLCGHWNHGKKRRKRMLRYYLVENLASN